MWIDMQSAVELTVSSGVRLSETNISATAPLAARPAGVGEGASGRVSLAAESPAHSI